jgi:glycerol-3-phosphate acyltransferase PlsY
VSLTSYIVVALGGYLVGSIPTGYLVAKARGVDIRTVGSKNMGATNVFRTLGKGLGIFVLLVDAFKGYAACAWVTGAGLELLQLPNSQPALAQVVTGISAVLGHNYTCWLRFQGGKGIATSAGVFLALAPIATWVALLAWALVFAATRYVSVASIVAAIALPVTCWFSQPDNQPARILAIALGVLAIYKHRANIDRLRKGTENRIVFKKAEANK